MTRTSSRKLSVSTLVIVVSGGGAAFALEGEALAKGSTPTLEQARVAAPQTRPNAFPGQGLDRG